MIEARELPASYYASPVVQGSTELVVPISLFVDGVPYSNSDSIIGWWAINEISGERHLLVPLRKQIVCQ